MDALLLDTNIVSYFMNGHTYANNYRHHLESKKTLAISFMTVGEMYFGAYQKDWNDNKLERLKAELKKYLLLPCTYHVCTIWAKIRSDRKKQPISVDDAWIAATAIAYNCHLVTHNPTDFAGIAGLSIITEQWSGRGNN